MTVRVKTALVNDRRVGTEPIEVEASGGVVRLSGGVGSPDLAERAVTLAAAVEGVREVQSTLDTAPVATETTRRRRSGSRTRTGGAAEREEPGLPLFGIGGGVDLHSPTDESLDRTITVRPAFLFRPTAGFGPAFGLGWFPSDLAGPGLGDGPAGRLRVRPVMGGVGYSALRGPAWVTASLVAGLSFNAITPSELADAEVRAIAVDRSFAWRPGVRVGYFVSPRISVDGIVGYVVTRPDVRFLGPDGITTSSVKADALQLRFSLVYWPF